MLRGGAVVEFAARVVEPRRAGPGAPPLLVLLHGIGADENDLLPLAPHLDPRFRFVSLRAPRPWAPGFAWFPIEFRSDGSVLPDVAEAVRARDDLRRWVIGAPARYGTDPGRTYLLGFSQGAMMSLGVLSSAPEALAGVVALSGRSPAGLFPATAAADAIARVPLLVAHGTADPVLAVENGRRIRDAFSGLSRDLTYQEFPIGHTIGDAELRLVADWLTRHLDAR